MLALLAQIGLAVIGLVGIVIAYIVYLGIIANMFFYPSEAIFEKFIARPVGVLALIAPIPLGAFFLIS
jgi:hypothetical protein